MAALDRCPSCGFDEIEPDFSRCPMCRADLRRSTPKLPPPSGAPPTPTPDPLQTRVRAEPKGRLPVAHLVITEGPGAGGSFQLGENTRIGRDKAQNQIVLADMAVSKVHGKIGYEDHRFVYYDVGSTNGSWLTTPQGVKQRVKGPVSLRDGDQLKLGDTTLAFREAAGT